jgi:hypothetical protein
VFHVEHHGLLVSVVATSASGSPPPGGGRRASPVSPPPVVMLPAKRVKCEWLVAVEAKVDVKRWRRSRAA